MLFECLWKENCTGDIHVGRIQTSRIQNKFSEVKFTMSTECAYLKIKLKRVRDKFRSVFFSFGYQIRVYEMKEGNGFRCLHQLDIAKMLQTQRQSKERERHSAEKGMLY